MKGEGIEGKKRKEKGRGREDEKEGRIGCGVERGRGLEGRETWRGVKGSGREGGKGSGRGEYYSLSTLQNLFI